MNPPTLNKIISIDELWRFFNLSTSLLCIAGTNGYLKYTNPSFTTILGYTEDEMLSKQLAEFVHPDDQNLTHQIFKSLEQGTTVSFRNRCQSVHGVTKWFDWSITYPNNDGLIYATAHDCTDKHDIEIELVQEKIDKQKSIAEATLYGQEMEKNEIGKELHDNINQMLTTVKLYHEMALSNKEMNTDLIKKGSSILIAAIEEIRGLSKSLVAPSENEVSLTDSVNDLIQTIMDSRKIKIEFQNNCCEDLSSKLRLTFFRIIQEQMNNIVKHSEAESVIIEILRDSEFIKLNIRDNGKGFDSRKKKTGIGLNNIISRVRLYNGKVTIDTAPGKGCSLSVAIPVEVEYDVAA